VQISIRQLHIKTNIKDPKKHFESWNGQSCVTIGVSQTSTSLGICIIYCRGHTGSHSTTLVFVILHEEQKYRKDRRKRFVNILSICLPVSCNAAIEAKNLD
jgi:hypothetical protein